MDILTTIASKLSIKIKCSHFQLLKIYKSIKISFVIDYQGSWMGQGGDNAVMGSPGNGGTSNSSSSDVSWRSGTPSPQLSEEGAPVATSTWPTSNNPNIGVRSIANNNNININNNNNDHCNASTSHHQLNSSYNVSGSSPGSTPNSSGTFDEGIVTDYLEEMHPRKKKVCFNI